MKQFPWIMHRSLREVAETEDLQRRWDFGENLSPDNQRRLADLMTRAQRACGAHFGNMPQISD